MLVRALIALISMSSVMQIGRAANVLQGSGSGSGSEHHGLKTISECAAKGGECDESRGRSVCGTDDQTYPTRCHLKRVQCSGYQVSLKYRGPCRACKEARDYALKHKAKNSSKFIPRCKKDGTYAPVQCLGDSGCWCSDYTGRPIKNTSVRTGKPNCRKFNKPNIRRSPALSAHQQGRRCTDMDRLSFNVNLLNIFQSEYQRQHHQPHNGEAADRNASPGEFNGAVEKRILDWKFAVLDANANQMLDKQEFRELKNLVKRAVKPKRCGRTFGKFCDLDEDERLSLYEWKTCITSTNHSGLGHGPYQGARNDQTGNNKKNGGYADVENESSQQHLEYEDSGEYDPKDSDYLSIIHSAGSALKYPSISVLRPNPESPLKELEADSDCLTEQATALETQKLGGTILYVPECSPDGRRYQRIQCYRSTPYCWCVNEESGKNIPGTSVKDKRPQCNDISMGPRTIKGCAEPKQTLFIKNLKEFLKGKIANANSQINSTTSTWKSEDERVTALSFLVLDKNKNKVWERKEWKSFREWMTNSKTLRQCGRKLPRFCDANSDKKITLSEWNECLLTETERNSSTTTAVINVHTGEAVTSKSPRLIGSNPLEQYLKD